MSHAKLSPSSSSRWLTCKASTVLNNDSVNSTSSASARGTLMHYMGEQCLLHGCNAFQFNGQVGAVSNHGDVVITVPSDPNVIHADFAFDIDDDMLNDVQGYVDYVRNQAGGCNGYVEQAVPIAHLTSENLAKGTIDFIAVNYNLGVLKVIDLKTGYNFVDVNRNTQLMMYALGALELFKPFMPTTVELHVYQTTQYPPASVCYLDVGELLEFGNAIRESCERIKVLTLDNLQTSDYAPSAENCRYCRASTSCPALNGFVDESLSLDLNNAKQLGDAYQRLDAVKAWCKAVEEKTFATLMEGKPVTGLKLVEGKQGNRKWADEDLVIEALKKLKLSDDEIFESSLLSPAKLEKLKGVDKTTIGEIINKFVTRSPASATIALQNDLRKDFFSANIATVDDFE